MNASTHQSQTGLARERRGLGLKAAVTQKPDEVAA